MIVILTDFGDSEYVGVMKGVIYSGCPDAKVVDLCNNIGLHNIIEGAWILSRNYPYFPKGTIFLCVVDPGVGSVRQGVVVQTKDYYFIGPDNGLIYPAAVTDGIKKVLRLDSRNASKTFHGRDVFAKAAAHLENGSDVQEIGIETRLETELSLECKNKQGIVVRIDPFGNIITNIPPLEKKEYLLGEKKIPFYPTYAEAKNAGLFVITGSSGTLEISIRNGSAQESLNLSVGDAITIN